MSRGVYRTRQGAILGLYEAKKQNGAARWSTPTSRPRVSEVEQAHLQGGANDTNLSDPASDTADFSDFALENLRAEYVHPRKTLQI